MFKNPFIFEGRIRRSEFGISFILFIVARVITIIIIAGIISGSNDKDGAVILSFLLLIPVLWFLWAQGAKRCHDLGNSGWFQLIPFYALWMLFQDGEPGPNQYGENPKIFKTITTLRIIKTIIPITIINQITLVIQVIMVVVTIHLV